MYFMPSKYIEYLNMYLQIWKKYLYLTQVLPKVLDANPEVHFADKIFSV